MKDLNPVHFFLGIQVHRSTTRFFLSQEQYADEILDRAGMSACKPAATSVDTKAKLPSDAGKPIDDPTFYHSIVGALQFVTMTRPDLTYAVQQACLHMHDPKDVHWSVCCAMCMALRARVCNFTVRPLWHSLATPTRTGPVARTRSDQCRAFACSSATRWCLGHPNDSPSSPDQARRLSIEGSPMSRRSAVGFDTFLANFYSRWPRRQ
ncbi:unnamed protein product [Urochloa humidicola]